MTDTAKVAFEANTEKYLRDLDEAKSRTARTFQEIDDETRKTGDLGKFESEIRLAADLIDKLAEGVRSAAEGSDFETLQQHAEALGDALVAVRSQADRIDPQRTEELTDALGRATAAAAQTFSTLSGTEEAEAAARRYGHSLADISEEMADILTQGVRTQDELEEMGDIRLGPLRHDLAELKRCLVEVAKQKGFEPHQADARQLVQVLTVLQRELQDTRRGLDTVEEELRDVEDAAHDAGDQIERLQDTAKNGVTLPVAPPQSPAAPAAPSAPSASPGRAPSAGGGKPASGPKISQEAEVIGALADRRKKAAETIAFLRQSLNAGDFVGAASALTAVGGAIAALGVSAAAAKAVEFLVTQLVAASKAAEQLQKITDRIDFQAANPREAAADYEFLRANVARLGGDLDEGSQIWAQFRQEANAAGVEVSAQRALFEGATTAVIGTGGAYQDTGALLSLFAELHKKARLEVADLVALSEQVPGGQATVQAALGKSAKAAEEMARKGELLTQDVLPALAFAMTDRFAASAADAADTVEAATNRVALSWQDLQAVIGGPNNERVIDFLNTATLGLKGLQPEAEAAAEAIASAVDTEVAKLGLLVAAFSLINPRARQFLESVDDSAERLDAQAAATLRARGATLSGAEALDEMTKAQTQASEGGGATALAMAGVEVAIKALRQEGAAAPADLAKVQASIDALKATGESAGEISILEERLRALRAELGLLPEVVTSLDALGAARDRLASGNGSFADTLGAVDTAITALSRSARVTPDQLSQVRASIDALAAQAGDDSAGRLLDLEARFDSLARRANRFRDEVNPIFQTLEGFGAKVLEVRDAFAQLDQDSSPARVRAVREAVEQLVEQMQEAGVQIPADLARIGDAVGASLSDVDRFIADLRDKPQEARRELSLLVETVDRLPDSLRANSAVSTALRERVESLTQAWLAQGATLRTIPPELVALRREMGLVTSEAQKLLKDGVDRAEEMAGRVRTLSEAFGLLRGNTEFLNALNGDLADPAAVANLANLREQTTELFGLYEGSPIPTELQRIAEALLPPGELLRLTIKDADQLKAALAAIGEGAEAGASRAAEALGDIEARAKRLAELEFNQGLLSPDDLNELFSLRDGYNGVAEGVANAAAATRQYASGQTALDRDPNAKNLTLFGGNQQALDAEIDRLVKAQQQAGRGFIETQEQADEFNDSLQRHLPTFGQVEGQLIAMADGVNLWQGANKRAEQSADQLAANAERAGISITAAAQATTAAAQSQSGASSAIASGFQEQATASAAAARAGEEYSGQLATLSKRQTDYGSAAGEVRARFDEQEKAARGAAEAGAEAGEKGAKGQKTAQEAAEEHLKVLKELEKTAERMPEVFEAGAPRVRAALTELIQLCQTLRDCWDAVGKKARG